MATAGFAPAVVSAQGAAKVVVVGGGFAGVACARALHTLDANLQVTLVAGGKSFAACPFSSSVIAGLREPAQQDFPYDRVAATGVRVVTEAATAADPAARTVTLAGGDKLAWDRLVMAPGVEMNFKAIAGYTEAAAEKMPHAWTGGPQTVLLRRQLEAMPDGGLVVITAPATPYRCPPAPYERAGLIAHYLKAHKPRSKVMILDAKDGYSKQHLFEEAWAALYPGLIERVALSKGGSVTSVDPGTMTVKTDFEDYKAAVANIVPPQRAAAIAAVAGVADRTGWCPIEPVGFESTLQPGIHVLGDAALMGAMPKGRACRCRPGQGLRGGGRRQAARARARGAGAREHLLQPRRAGLGLRRNQQVPARERLAHGGARRGLHQPARRKAGGARRRGERGRGLVPHADGRPVRMKRAVVALLLLLPGLAWAQVDSMPSLTGKPGDPVRGRALVANRTVGLCLLCHSAPIPEERFQGTLAPSLAGAGARATPAQLRLRVADAARLNPDTIMPPYYRVDGLTRVAKNFQGKTILTAEQIEDVVAFLASLRE